MLIARLLTGRRRERYREGHGQAERDMSCKGKWRGHFEAKWKEMEAQDDHMGEDTTSETQKKGDDKDYKEGFTSGKWEVNVVDVNEEPAEEEMDAPASEENNEHPPKEDQDPQSDI